MERQLRVHFTCLTIVTVFATVSVSEADSSNSHRPPVAGKIRLMARSRVESPAGSGKFEPAVKETIWDASKTAIIICDMWNDHYCKLAAQRVGVMVPKMNRTVSAARNHGVLIIHAPSGTMEVYDKTPYRQRLRLAPAVKPPIPIAPSCDRQTDWEPPLPVEVSKCPCDDPVVGPAVKVFDRQHARLDIIGFDGITDSGVEVFNYCRQLGITNIAMMGVHTNMCVLGRSFGIRQLTKLGFNVVLVRDLTDAMYDPRQPPYVSHARGTELVVEHIEKYWCPSIVSDDLTRVIEGSAGP